MNIVATSPRHAPTNTRARSAVDSAALSTEGHLQLSDGDLLAGRYRICELLGEGGYGRVFRAVQLPLEREVAVKIVNARDSELAARFVREAAIVRSLEHPNTVRVLDVGTTPEGAPFIVLELLRGQDVDQLLEREGCLSAEAALDITAQVLKSLAEAHEKGIVHRDIKPGSVFITSHFGEPLFVKVLDFGIAKQLRSGDKLTALGETLGTPSYMPPEQALGRPIDARTDIYAVGLMLAEMFTGKLVFAKGGPMTIVNAQAGPEPVALGSEVTASVIGPIVMRAVQKDPRERYQSASEMLRDVEATRRSLTRVPTAPATSPAAPSSPSATQADAATIVSPTAWPLGPKVTAVQGTAAQLTAAQPTVAYQTPGALPFTSQQASYVAPPPPPPAVSAAPPREHRQRPLIIAMGVTIAVLATLLGLALLSRGDSNKRRADPDEEESEPEPTRTQRSVRSARPPVTVPLARRGRNNQELKRAFRDNGYTLSSIQEGPEDALVYTFAIQKAACSGSLARLVSHNETIAAAQAKNILQSPGCRVLVEENIVIYACFGQGALSDQCADAAASLFSK